MFAGVRGRVSVSDGGCRQQLLVPLGTCCPGCQGSRAVGSVLVLFSLGLSSSSHFWNFYSLWSFLPFSGTWGCPSLQLLVGCSHDPRVRGHALTSLPFLADLREQCWSSALWAGPGHMSPPLVPCGFWPVDASAHRHPLMPGSTRLRPLILSHHESSSQVRQELSSGFWAPWKDWSLVSGLDSGVQSLTSILLTLGSGPVPARLWAPSPSSLPSLSALAPLFLFDSSVPRVPPLRFFLRGPPKALLGNLGPPWLLAQAGS